MSNKIGSIYSSTVKQFTIGICRYLCLKFLPFLNYVLFFYFLGPRKKLLHYLDVRKAILEKKLSGLEEYQATSVTNSVQYRIGPAGTGQPSVIYPKLDFEPVSFYALGSPIALFNAVRGIESLG